MNTDEIRLGLAALGSQNNKSISLEATLPIIDGYKKLIVAFTAQELEYNGTSVGLEIYDESGKIEDLDLYYGTNRILKFYCLAGTWFREHYRHSVLRDSSAFLAKPCRYFQQLVVNMPKPSCRIVPWVKVAFESD
ncbi:hypothetical protein N9098_01595 [bacterium]|nr:hypothetical protein [bacterium]